MSKVYELHQTIYEMMTGKHVVDLHLLKEMAWEAHLEYESRPTLIALDRKSGAMEDLIIPYVGPALDNEGNVLEDFALAEVEALEKANDFFREPPNTRST